MQLQDQIPAHVGITTEELYKARDMAGTGCLRPVYEKWYARYKQSRHAGQGKGFCFGAGDPGSAKVLAIGEGPGKHEGHTGIIFSGPAGTVLSSVLKAVGLSRQEDVFLINTITEMRDPPVNTRMESGKPSTRDLYEERARVLEVINALSQRPQGLKSVVVLGKFALVQLFDPKRLYDAVTSGHEVNMDTIAISDFRGWRDDVPDVEVPTYVIQHPSWLLRMSLSAGRSPRESQQFTSAKRLYAAAWKNIQERTLRR